MSPRAACRLETLGFLRVFDYVPGKADWLARGLPREGENAAERRAGELARDDVVTAQLDEPSGEIRPRVESSPYGFAFVISAAGTLLGRLRKSALCGDPHLAAGDAMEPGPSTLRADTSLGSLRRRLDERSLKTAVVTSPEGKLIGVVRRTDLPQ
jgi:hypothetical protein